MTNLYTYEPPIRALTVQQPWAWAIVNGRKRVENRTTLWKWRGPLAIHAGTRWSDRGGRSGLIWDDLRDVYGWPTGPVTARDDHRPGFDCIRPLGAIIGTVDLVDVHPAANEHYDDHGLRVDFCCDDPYAETQYVEHGGKTRRQIVHLVTENPRPLSEPIPAVGALGLWKPDRDVVERLVG